jgi:cell division protein FtsB
MRHPQPDPISIAARAIIGALFAVLLGLLGWFGSQNQAVHTVLFQKVAANAEAADKRLDKLEAEVARLRERVRIDRTRK